MKKNFANFADRAYSRFKSLVSDGRKMDVDDVEEIAQGKVWTGKQAQAIGLVDELGGLHSAIAYCQQNFTEDGNASVVTWPPRKSLLEILSGGSEDLEDNLPGGLASAQSLITKFLNLGMVIQSISNTEA